MDQSIDDRAREMCSSLGEPVRSRATELAVNVLWMEAKLEDARRVIAGSSVAIPYDNGGGQKGVRRNPAYDGYNALMSSYTKAVRQLCDLLGKDGHGQGPASMDLDAILSGGTRKTKGRARP